MWLKDKKLPAKISKIHKRRRLYKGLLEPLVGTTPSRSNVLEIVGAITSRFKEFKDNPSWGGLYKTIENFTIGREVKEETIDHLSKVLAGNETDMKVGKVVSPELSFSGDRFILAKIVDCFVSYKKDGEKFIVYFELLTTEHAGSEFKTSITVRTLNRLQESVGLKRRFEPIRVHHREVVGLYIFIRPCTNDDWVYVADWATTSTLKTRNKKLINARKLSQRACPVNADWPCFMCPIGNGKHNAKRCALSTHREHYKREVCTLCEQEDLVDPSARSGHCLACQRFYWDGT